MKRLLSLVMFTALIVGAQKYAPLPKEITDAKTIYILNLTGAPESLDAAYKELRSWKRFEILNEKDKADLIFVLAVSESADSGAIAMPLFGGIVMVPTRTGFTTLHIFNSSKPDARPIWSVTRSWGQGGTKSCIKELRKRFTKEK